MKRKLYELLGDGDRRFSPYCWRARMALAHKGLDVDYEPCRFTDKEKIAFSGQKFLPVLVDGEKVIADSWAIACYLEDTYPQAPTLFGGKTGRALSRFVNLWADMQFNPSVAKCIVADLVEVLDPADVNYFRETREARFGRKLESFAEDRDANLAALKQAMAPLRQLLGENDFIAGDQPGYADYIVFGAFQWARGASPHDVLDEDDTAMRAWRARLRALHGGLADSVPVFASAA